MGWRSVINLIEALITVIPFGLKCPGLENNPGAAENGGMERNQQYPSFLPIWKVRGA